MLFNIKLENDNKPYEKLATDTADQALNCWLKNHTEYFINELILNQFKLLTVDINGQIYEIELRLNINVEKIK